jgi:DNA-binding transcriptional LysR family regulator
LDIRRLSYFMRIAEDGSLTRASNLLRIAQPALSRQMRLLEEELGITLYTRTARGMRLTEAGAALRDAVAGPLRELELALQNIRSFPATTQANVVLGLPLCLADTISTPLALRLGQLFPLFKLTIVEGITGSLADWLGRGVVDLVLLEGKTQNDQLHERILCSLPLTLAGPADAPFPAGEPIAFGTAAKLPLVVPSHHLGLRAAVNDAALSAQAKLNIRMEADSARLVKDLIAAGTGYSILPAGVCQGDARLRTWPLITPSPSLDIVLASRKSSQVAGARLGPLEDLIAGIALELLTA